MTEFVVIRPAEVRVPTVAASHHIRMPVSNVSVSRDWYTDILGFECVLAEEEENALTGVALRHPSGIVLGLHQEPHRARALRGFCILALAVRDIREWINYLDDRDIQHGDLTDGHLGRSVDIADPDGIIVQLHTLEQPSADEA